MKGKMTDAELANLFASLPYYAPAAGFNGRVLAGLGLAPQALPSRAWLLWAERTAGAMAACWLGAALFAALFLAAAHYQDLLPFLAEPRTILPVLKLYALKAGFFAMDLLRFLSLGKAVLADRAGGLDLLPKLTVSALLAWSVILALPKYTCAAGAAARR